jgi:ATP-dependent DNA helicase RecG
LSETERRVLLALRSGEKSTPDLLEALGAKTLSGGLKKALDRIMGLGLVEFTIPEKPRSKNQKRRLTAQGKRLAELLDQSPPSTKK